MSANAPSSGSIAQSVVREDRLEAMANVLNMTTSQVQTHLKAHDLKQVLANEGLSLQSSGQKVSAQLQSELQAQGYSQAQINSALQHYQHQRHFRQN
jgi:SOS response regulatory protein OraA/RecX